MSCHPKKPHGAPLAAQALVSPKAALTPTERVRAAALASHQGAPPARPARHHKPVARQPVNPTLQEQYALKKPTTLTPPTPRLATAHEVATRRAMLLREVAAIQRELDSLPTL